MRPPLGRYILRRVLYALPTLLGVTLAVFLLVRLFPGDLGPIIAGLPSLTLAAFSTAIVARMTRGSLLETLGLDFVRTARAKGMGKWAVIIHHALRNALIPVVTVIGLQFGTLLGGAVLTETTFAWPGLGRLLVSAITARDYPVIQGIVIIFAAMFVVVNLVTDLLYVAIDPRIRYE